MAGRQEDDWRTPERRQMVVRRIADTVQQFPEIHEILKRSPNEIEETIYSKVNDKESYVNLVDRVLLSIKNKGQQLMERRLQSEANSAVLNKLQELQPYLPSLARLMDRIEKGLQGDDKTKNEHWVKLNSLYNVIQSKNIKVPLGTLEKCHTALKSLFNKADPTTDISDDIFVKAIDEGSGYLKPAVVIMHGPPGVGKTSVKQLILGRPPLLPEKQNSTDILERPIRTCRVKCGGIHRLCEVDKEQFHHMLLNTVHAETTDPKYRKELGGLHLESDTLTSSHSPGTSHTAPVSSTLPGTSHTAPVSSTLPGTSHTVPVSSTLPGTSHTVPVSSTLPGTSHTVPVSKSAPSIDSSNTLKVMKEKFSTAESSRDLFDLDWIHLVDSGGQPQFTDVLPLLFCSEALYIVVIRLDQGLDELPGNCYRRNGKAYKLPDNLSLTNRQIIERACQIAEASSSTSSPKQVFVIGTRFDKLDNPEAKVKIIDNELLKLHEKYEGVLVPKDSNSGKIIFPVNAMSTGAEREAYTTELQQCLMKIVKQSIQPIEVPLKWFVYELDLDEASKETHGVVRKSKCEELGKSLGMASDEIEHSLQFFNKLALHLYRPIDEDFPDLVLMKMDPLTDRLSSLIRTSFERPQYTPTEECSRLKRCGLFRTSYLRIAFEGISDDGAISYNDFLRISQCLKVIVHVGGDQYFIPSALSVNSQAPLEYNCVPVVYNWKEYILPSGFFFTLVVELLRLEDEEERETHFVLSNVEILPQSRDRLELFARLHGGTLTLTNGQKWIGVYYAIFSNNALENYVEILKLVHVALVKVVEQFIKVAGVRFPYICFLCPNCDTRDHPCSMNKVRTLCICPLDGRKVSPVKNEMKTIMESLHSLPVPVESVRAVRNRKRKMDERETRSEELVAEELLSTKRKPIVTIDTAGAGSSSSAQQLSSCLGRVQTGLNYSTQNKTGLSSILKKYTARLVVAISNPEQLAVSMWSEDLISDSVKDDILNTDGLSRFKKANKLMDKIYRYSKTVVATNSKLLPTFCTMLKSQNDPPLTDIADEIAKEPQ